MHFTTFIPIVATLLGTATAGVNIQAWQGTGCFNGNNAYVSDIAAFTCYAFPNSFGVQLQNVPEGAKGQAYYNSGCSTFAQAGGSGTYCLDAHNNMKSANWFWPFKLLRREPEVLNTHSGFQYVTEEGTTRYILCDVSEFEKIFALVDAKDWKALNQYPEDPNPAVQEL